MLDFTLLNTTPVVLDFLLPGVRAVKLIYDGLLTAQVADYVKGAAREYQHVLELTSMPLDWSQWSRANLKDYPRVGETCMGQKYTDTSKRYMLVTNGDVSVFLFLASAAEWQAVRQEFAEWVVSDKPFRTLID